MSIALDRSTFLGGSDAAAVLGLSPYTTPYKLWLEKTGRPVDEPTDQQRKSWSRGKRLEPYVIDWARDEYGLEITSRNSRYQRSDLPHLSCEIDFEWVDDDATVQNADVKTVHPRMAREWGEEGTDEIPLYYTVQFLFGLGITERERTLCMALIGADDLRPYRVNRDDAMIQHIFERCTDFWENNVLKDVPPPITTIDDARLAWAKDSGNKIEATSEIAGMALQLDMMKTALTGDQAKCGLLELQIKKFMRDATELVGPDGEKLASWKSQDRKGYSVQPSSCRVFRTY